MPYIPKVKRQLYERELNNLSRRINQTDQKGDLTYLVYVLGINFFKGKKSYTNISNAIGALYDAAEEIRRRYLNKYEDRKRRENGDID